MVKKILTTTTLCIQNIDYIQNPQSFLMFQRFFQQKQDRIEGCYCGSRKRGWITGKLWVVREKVADEGYAEETWELRFRLGEILLMEHLMVSISPWEKGLRGGIWTPPKKITVNNWHNRKKCYPYQRFQIIYQEKYLIIFLISHNIRNWNFHC